MDLNQHGTLEKYFTMIIKQHTKITYDYNMLWPNVIERAT